MPLTRYLGYHFTPTRVFVAEAFISQTEKVVWEVIEQANYELPAEWLALYKEAIPNLYDASRGLYGFQALPALWGGINKNLLHRYDTEFFRKVAEGIQEKALFDEFTKFLRYALVYHIKPQHDEMLFVSIVIDDLQDTQLAAVIEQLKNRVQLPNVHFMAALSCQEAGLRYLWYESRDKPERITNRNMLLINIGYAHSEFTPWIQGDVQPSVRAYGVQHIDESLGQYIGAKKLVDGVDLTDIYVYIQRARADYTQGQGNILLYNRGTRTVEITEAEYRTLLADSIQEVFTRLKVVFRSTGEQFDEVVLAGEGAAFEPINTYVNNDIDRNQIRVVNHPALICAKGAAGYSYSEQNQ